MLVLSDQRGKAQVLRTEQRNSEASILQQQWGELEHRRQRNFILKLSQGYPTTGDAAHCSPGISKVPLV